MPFAKLLVWIRASCIRLDPRIYFFFLRGTGGSRRVQCIGAIWYSTLDTVDWVRVLASNLMCCRVYSGVPGSMLWENKCCERRVKTGSSLFSYSVCAPNNVGTPDLSRYHTR